MKKTMKIAILAILTGTAMSSCSKQDTIAPVVKIEKPAYEVSIDSLKKYLADRANVSVEEICYNEQTEQFSLRGIDQVSRLQLTEFYKFNNQ